MEASANIEKKGVLERLILRVLIKCAAILRYEGGSWL